MSRQLEFELTITGYVESVSGTWSLYLTVNDAPTTAVHDTALDHPDVEEVRIIEDEDEIGFVEFIMSGPALRELTEHGAVFTSGQATHGQGRFCIEVPQTADIRGLIDRFQATYPESRLLAQREFDRPVQNVIELRQSITDQLTDRQQEALMRAYHAGYFEWPRQSPAADIAESMDVAETTFHYHLRNALATLLEAFASLTD